MLWSIQSRPFKRLKDLNRDVIDSFNMKPLEKTKLVRALVTLWQQQQQPQQQPLQQEKNQTK
jgi:hypothetical protein